MQAAVRRETRADPGGPRAVGQWIRRALPVTLSEQGAIGAEGVPAVLLSASGELGPGGRRDASTASGCGRSAARRCAPSAASTPSAGATQPAFADAPSGIVTLRNVVSDWSVRLLVGALLLPALLAALDAFFRARRRHVPIAPWLGWLLVAAVPLPVAWLWLRGLGAAGLIDAPAGVVNPARWPVGTSGIVALVSAVVVAALAWFGARAAGPRRSARAPKAEEPVNGRRGPRRARRGRARGRDRGLAVRPGGARVGAQPLRCGPAHPRRAPVAVRRRRLARAGGGGGARRRARSCPYSRSCTSARRSTSARTSWSGGWRSRP